MLKTGVMISSTLFTLCIHHNVLTDFETKNG